MANKVLLLQPVVSEKSYNLANAENKYTFFINLSTSKIEVKKAVEKKYKVKVISVRTIIRPGKMKKDWKTYTKTRASDKKKAVVTLKSGDKIDEFLNI